MEWEVQEPYGGGLLRSVGPTVTYVAPEAAGAYHVVIRASRLDGRALHQTVTIQVLGASTLEPADAHTAPGGTIAFSAHLKGLGNGAVHWSVLEAEGGSITGSGEYTAPTRPGTYHVRAVSAADPAVQVVVD